MVLRSMTDVEKRAAAKHFVEVWTGKGYEKGESQKFWLSLLSDVMGVEHGLRLICAAYENDPEKIGVHMLEMLAKFRNEGIID